MKKDTLRLKETVETISRFAAAAAQTAPKAKGIDNLVMRIFTGNDIPELAAKMEETGKKTPRPQTFTRDAASVRKSSAVLVIGTHSQTLGLDCSFCGRNTCAEAEKDSVCCAYNLTDLGIAVGSAVSSAADFRIDNRIMYTVGYTVKKHNLMEYDIQMALGIPLSATEKNPFFDR